MRILLLCEGDPETHDSWSGVTRSVMYALRAAGHEVIGGDADLYGVARWVNAAATFSPQRRRWWVKYHLSEGAFRRRTRNAARLIAKYADRIDLILQVGATFKPAGRGSIPYVLYCDSNISLADRMRVSGHGEAVTQTPAEIEAIRRRETGIYRDAAAIFTFSDFLRTSFIEDFAVSPERVHTVYAGANLDPSTIEPRSRRGGANAPVVLFVGRDFERKGGSTLLQAFARVRQQVPEAELILVGPVGLSINAPGVRNVGFLDKDVPEDQARLRGLYQQAEVFALPTRFEPFGIAYVEAMAYGLPCIGTDTCAVPEIIEEGRTGYVVPVDDEEKLAERLLLLLTRPDIVNQMGVAGRARVENRFTWAAVADVMTEHLEDLIRGGSPEPPPSDGPGSPSRLRAAPRIARALRPLSQGGTVLCYHSIRTAGCPSDALVSVTREDFCAGVEAARAVGEIIPLRDLIALHQAGKKTAGLFAVTFDDAYASIAEVADVIRAESVPVTVFPVASAGNDPQPFWWDRLSDISARVSPLAWEAFTKRCGVPVHWREGEAEEFGPVWPLRQWITVRHHGRWPRELEAAIAALEESAGFRTAQRPMNWPELTALMKLPSVDLGVHTQTHAVLPLLPDEEAVSEMRDGYTELRDRFDRVYPIVAAPFGLFDRRTVQVARQAGMTAVLSLSNRTLRGFAADAEIPRFCIDRKQDALRLALRLSGALDHIRIALGTIERYPEIDVSDVPIRPERVRTRQRVHAG